MALNDIIAAVKSAIESVENAGPVYAYKRSIHSEQRFKELFAVLDGAETGTKKVLGWTVTRESTSSYQDTINATKRTHTIVVRGYLGMNEKNGSEAEFQTLIETVCAALDHDRTFGDTCNEAAPAQVRTCTDGMFCGVLVHYCELAIAAEMNPVGR